LIVIISGELVSEQLSSVSSTETKLFWVATVLKMIMRHK